jgi:hypothetical protein
LNQNENTASELFNNAVRRRGRAKLVDLQDGYDTTELLRQVERLEPIMRRLKRSNGIRDDILRLHRMPTR